MAALVLATVVVTIIRDGQPVQRHPIALANASAGDISTVAGGVGIGDATTIAQEPVGIAVDGSGDLFVDDAVHALIREVNPSTDVSTVFAGTGSIGETGDNGSANAAQIGSPVDLAIDANGNLLIADTNNCVIRVVARSNGSYYGVSMTDGDIYKIVGNGSCGYSGDGGAATSAELHHPSDVVTDANGNLVIADEYYNIIRVVAESTGTFYGTSMTAGDIYTVVGYGGRGSSGDGGPATSATLNEPTSVAVDASGNVIIADYSNFRVRILAASSGTDYGMSLTAGDIYTLAGTGTGGYSGDSGPADLAKVYAYGVGADSDGNALIYDSANNRVRVVAGGSGTFYGISMTAGDIYTIAGNGTAAYSGDGGSATSAELNNPDAGAVDSHGNVIVADAVNDRVRVITKTTGTYYGISMTAGDIYTVAGDGFAALSGDGAGAALSEMYQPSTTAVDGHGNLVVADRYNDVIRVVAATSGTFYGTAMTAGDIYTVAGNGIDGYSGDGGAATSAELNAPRGIDLDGSGNLVIADTGDDVVRVVAVTTGTFYGISMTAGDIYTVAGNASPGYSGNGGSATSAELNAPGRAAVDAHGNLVIADMLNDAIRVVAATTGTFYSISMTAGDIYTVAGNGSGGYSGDGGAATSAELFQPIDVAVDHYGNLLVADRLNERIRLVAEVTGTYYGISMTAGDIYTVAGTGGYGFSGDGGAATSAELWIPSGVALDPNGNLLIADTDNSSVRVVAATTGTWYQTSMTVGHIYTVAGEDNTGYSGDGGAATSAQLNLPTGVTVDGQGDIVIADTSNNVVREVTEGASITVLRAVSLASSDGSKDYHACSNGSYPVDCASGDFWHTFTDVSVPGRGPGLDLTRTYNSLSAAREGIFGYGWSSSYDMNVTLNGDGSATVTEDDGSQVTAPPNGSGGFTVPSWADSTLTYSSGTWTFVQHATTTYTFNSLGQLTAITDLNGNATTLSYNGSNQLTTVTDSSSRTITLAYGGNGLVSEVTDPASNHTYYGYDGSDNLTSVTDPLMNETSFSYDANHLMLTMTMPNGQLGGPDAGDDVSNTYDSSGRIVSQTDPAGLTTTYSYSGSNFSDAGGATTITDPHGNVEVQDYTDGLLTSLTKGYGTPSAATWTYDYDSTSLGETSVTDPNGYTTTNTYYSNGNLHTSTDPLTNETVYTYNSFNEPLTVTDPVGIETVNTYNAHGQLTEKDVDGLDSTDTTTTYTVCQEGTMCAVGYEPGDVESMTDPNTNTTTYTYDSYGDVATTSLTVGLLTDVTTDAYDDLGHLYCEVSPNANAASVTCPAFGMTRHADTTTYTYDADGNKLSVTDPDGNETTYGYDADNNQTSVTDPLTNETKTNYDADDRVTSVTDGYGSAAATTTNDTYDIAPGSCPTDPTGTTYCTQTENGLSQTTTSYYNALDQMIEQDAPNTTDQTPTTYTYDGVGNVLTKIDGSGTATYTYYHDNTLESVTYSSTQTGYAEPSNVSYTYDADGNRTEMVDGTGTTTYTYDGLERLQKVDDGDGKVVTYGYDNNGNTTCLTYPNSGSDTCQNSSSGTGLVNYEYNADNTVEQMTDWLGSGNTTSFSYDNDGNLTGITYPSGTTTSASETYDDADALSDTSYTIGATTTDLAALTPNADELIGTTTPPVGSPTTYGYDALNRVTTGTTASYTYDDASEIESVTPTGGSTTDFSYNADGQLCWTATSAAACSSPPSGATAFTYSTVGERLSRTPSGGHPTTYGWDQAGNLVCETAANASTYSCSNPHSTVTTTYGYNGDGLRMSDTPAGGSTQQFTWDVSSSVPQLLADGSNYYLYGPNVGAAPLEQISGSTPTYLISDTTGVRDQIGSSGSVVGSMSYDSYGNSCSLCSISTPFGFEGAYTDVTGLDYLVHRYFDPVTEQFLSVDPLVDETGTPYAFTDGDPVNGTDPTGEYAKNATVTVNVNNGATELKVNANFAVAVQAVSGSKDEAHLAVSVLEAYAPEIQDSTSFAPLMNPPPGQVSPSAMFALQVVQFIQTSAGGSGGAFGSFASHAGAYNPNLAYYVFELKLTSASALLGAASEILKEATDKSIDAAELAYLRPEGCPLSSGTTVA